MIRLLLCLLALLTLSPLAMARPSGDVGFASREKLQQHYRKHGREFGRISAERYLRMAQELRDRPVGGNVLELRRDDGMARFDRGSGAFLACARNGTIRTFFRPVDGERYFQRQARKQH